MVKKLKRKPREEAASDPDQRQEGATPPAREGAAEDSTQVTQPNPDLELVLVDDGLKAVVSAVFPHTTSEELQELLRAHDVSPVYFTAAIRKAVETARETGQTMTEVVVANGRPPQESPPPQVQYHAPDGLDELPSLEPVRQLISQHNPDELERAAASVHAWSVKPGDCLATLDFPEAKAGVNVQGRVIPPIYETSDPGIIQKLKPGAGVDLAENGADFMASIWGYAGMEYGQVTVLPAVWVAPNSMEACFLDLPRVAESRFPTKEDLQALLAFCDITAGIDEGAIESLCQAGTAEGIDEGAIESLCQAGTAEGDRPHLVTIALGRKAAPAPATDPTFHFKYDARAGTVRSDGTMDFKQRNLFPSVGESELLVEYAHPAPGEPGLTVRGKEIEVAEPVAAELLPGENVILEEEEGVQRLRSQIEGGASVSTAETHDSSGTLLTRQFTVSVQPVASIPGTVDYKTGNIDFQGNVVIGGSIASGFRVKASGDVAIAGNVEPGGIVEAGGDITVQQGISGNETTVKAGSTVTAKFIQDASVSAGTDVVVASYLRGAHTDAGGSVKVEGAGGSGGGIVGGETWAVNCITSRNVGAEGSGTTSLFVGLVPGQLAHLKQLKQNQKKADSMLGQLGAGASTDKSTQQETASRDAKDARLTEIRDQLLDEEKELMEQIGRDTEHARIEIPERASGKVDVHFGFHHIVVLENLNHIRMRHDPESGEPGIVWSDLA